MRFVIIGPDYNSQSGGIIALHKLAHNLTLIGEDAYLLCNGKNLKWKGKLLKDEQYKQFDKNKTVVIYPEIYCGNPLESKYVVRWLLNTPGVVGGDGIYESTDMIFKYANYFKAPDESRVLGELRAFDLQLDIFRDLGKKRSGECHLIRKGGNKTHDKHSPDSLNIDDYPSKGGNNYLNKIFNEKEKFISYDHACFVSVQAALCGCVSVVIPDGISSKEDWKKQFPYFSHGIAYGLDDVQWAKDTKHLVREHLQSLENETIELTKNFVRICKERIV